MSNLIEMVLPFLKSEEGATARKIALKVALIFIIVVVVFVAAITLLGTTVSGNFSTVAGSTKLPGPVKIDKPR